MTAEASAIDNATQPKVIIRCLVYNHEPYLRDCLEGFVMQKTNFPFKAVVHDDCSTDNSAAIIREYAEKYPDIIEPIFETENQYSKRDGSLRRIMDAATLGRSPYIAYCEGDDYWIDPLKLQKQVDFLDSHKDYTLVATQVEVQVDGIALTQDELEKKGWWPGNKSREVPTDEIIQTAAASFHTCSLLFKSDIILNLPPAAKTCCVGDYPLEVFAALNGRVYFFSSTTAVYRYLSQGSWSLNNQTNSKQGTIKDLDYWFTLVTMLETMNEYSKGKQQALLRHMQIVTIMTRLDKNPQLLPILYTKPYSRILFKDYYQMRYFDRRYNKLKSFLIKIRYFPFYPYCASLNEATKRLPYIKRFFYAIIYILNKHN